MTKQTRTSISNAKSAKKSHYPAAKVSANAIRVAKTARASKNEKFGLTQLVELVCNAEENSLSTYLDAQTDLPNRHIIKNVLLTILQQLPEKVEAAGGNSANFAPEVSKEERAAVQAQRKKLHELEELSARLQRLEEDSDALREATGLWLGKVPADVVPVIPVSSQVAESAGAFKSQLESMNAVCDQILAFAQECKSAASKTENVQRRLYKMFNEVSSVHRRVASFVSAVSVFVGCSVATTGSCDNRNSGRRRTDQWGRGASRNTRFIAQYAAILSIGPQRWRHRLQRCLQCPVMFCT